MSTTEQNLEASLPSTEFQHQAVVITVLIDSKTTVSSQSSLSDLSRNTILLIEVKIPFDGLDASPDDTMAIPGLLVVLFQVLYMIQKIRKKI